MNKDRQIAVGNMVHNAGAYSIKPNEPFIFVSKILSPDYVDIRLILGKEKFRTPIINYLVETIKGTGANPDYICGVVTADVPFASIAAHEMKTGMFYIRDSEKGHGKRRLIEGVPEGAIEDKECIHVGDLISVGTTGNLAHKEITKEGGRLPYHVPVFNRLQGGPENLRALKPPVETIALCEMDDGFYQIGIEQGKYTTTDLEEVFKARSYSDKSQWGREFLSENPDFVKRQIQKNAKDGVLKKADILESLTGPYKDLLDEFKPELNKWLKELEVNHPVRVEGEEGALFEYHP